MRFLKLASERHHKTLHGFDASAIDLLSHADWVGNVRELQNEIERLVALAADGQTITANHLSPELRLAGVSGGATAATRAALSPGGEDHASASPSQASSERNTRAATSLQHARAAFEARFISQVLGEHGGNVSHAAVALCVSRVALQKKMKRYRLR